MGTCAKYIIIVLALSNGNKCTPHGLLHSAGPGGPVPLSTVGGYKFIQSKQFNSVSNH